MEFEYFNQYGDKCFCNIDMNNKIVLQKLMEYNPLTNDTNRDKGLEFALV